MLFLKVKSILIKKARVHAEINTEPYIRNLPFKISDLYN